jgi:AmmeMemoRadiSam system protein A
MTYTTEHKNLLLSLARESLDTYAKTGKSPSIDPSTIPKELTEKKGTFVTLTIEGALRGCIGHIEPVQEIYLDVIDNAINAGFCDPRFPELSQAEIEVVSIEISILSLPKKLTVQDSDSICKTLRPRIDGVILEKDGHRATFLPQVWDELTDAESFLSELSHKAGLSPDSWKKGATLYVYQVESFSE